MKKSLVFTILFAFLVVGIFSVSGVYAASNSCNLKVSMVNQDPATAVQGDTVKVLFQVSGVSNPDCKGAVFTLDPGYAFSFTQNDATRILSGSTYTQNYQNDWAIPYTLRVNPDAPDGNVQVQAFYSPGTNPNTTGLLSNTFNISIQDSRADFEVYVKNYDATANTITFQILNIAKVDVKAVTVTIPEQNSLQIQGSNTNIIGDLDSNEYTTADFTGTPSNGNITLDLSYTDQAGVRRQTEKQVVYDSKFFQSSSSKSGGSAWTWIIILVIIALLVYWYLKKKSKKKKLLEERKNRMK